MSSETRLPRVKSLFLDKDKLRYHNKSVYLSSQLRILIRAFLTNPGQVIAYERFEHDLYSGVRDTDLPDRPRLIVTVLMGQLRKRLSTLGIARDVIVTVYDEGYWLNCEWVKEELIVDHEEAIVSAAMEVAEWLRALKCGMPAQNALKQARLGLFDACNDLAEYSEKRREELG